MHIPQCQQAYDILWYSWFWFLRALNSRYSSWVCPKSGGYSIHNYNNYYQLPASKGPPSDSRDWPRGCGVWPLPQDQVMALLREVPSNESSKTYANTRPFWQYLIDFMSNFRASGNQTWQGKIPYKRTWRFLQCTRTFILQVYPSVDIQTYDMYIYIHVVDMCVYVCAVHHLSKIYPHL